MCHIDLIGIRAPNAGQPGFRLARSLSANRLSPGQGGLLFRRYGLLARSYAASRDFALQTAVRFSPHADNRFPLTRCASAIQIDGSHGVSYFSCDVSRTIAAS
jgi:hypothetical protein